MSKNIPSRNKREGYYWGIATVFTGDGYGHTWNCLKKHYRGPGRLRMLG